MRTLLVLLSLATTADAWEFTPGIPCVLTHDTADADVELTYDPTAPRYTISIRRTQPWPDGRIFAMQFDGAMSLTISTDRHVLSQDGLSLTVSDRGFGNVLNGLQFNEEAIATLGNTQVRLPLSGAADPVAAFRLCRAEPGV